MLTEVNGPTERLAEVLFVLLFLWNGNRMGERLLQELDYRLSNGLYFSDGDDVTPRFHYLPQCQTHDWSTLTDKILILIFMHRNLLLGHDINRNAHQPT